MKSPKINLLILQVEIVVKNNVHLIAILNHRFKTSYTINIPFVNQINTPNTNLIFLQILNLSTKI